MNLNTLYKKYANRKHTIGYKFILSLFVGLIGLINFGYCDFTCTPIFAFERIIYGSYGQETINFRGGDSVCIINDSTNSALSYNFDNGSNKIDLGYREGHCFSQDELQGYSYFYLFSANNVIDAGFVYYPEDCIPKLTSLECQTEYSLIPISSIDTNYCVGNGFCPTNECIGTGGISELFINNIQKPGSPLINITIPEEIQRDEYYDSGESNIDIIGYGYDQDKMQQMVNTQYYKPTAEEMSGLMEKVADFLPLVAVALLITRLRRVIKKVF